MKVVFLCGSLERGRDGVGDYTRRLSGELLRRGHEASIIALFDTQVITLEEGSQVDECTSVKVTRIPFIFSASKRFEVAKNLIDLIDPEWLSIQFVIFSFNTKGLPFRLGNLFKKLVKGRKCEIMFHELWVGMQADAPKKYVIWGIMQKRIIKSVISNTRPTIIHTQCKLYLKQLSKLKYQVYYLPLFSNIPPVKTSKTSFPDHTTCWQEKKKISLVVFGTIHPGAPVETFMEEASLFAEKRNVDISMTLLGRNGSEAKVWIGLCKKFGLKVEVLGELAPELISEVLTRSTIGISTSALPMIDKSGTVAAMLEHGLPVICLSKKWTPKEVTVDSVPLGVYEFKQGIFDTCLSQVNTSTTTNSLRKITEMFVQSLEGPSDLNLKKY